MESKRSIFTLDQYMKLERRLSEAPFRMKEQQSLIDKMDSKVHDSIVKMRERRQGRAGSQLEVQQRAPL